MSSQKRKVNNYLRIKTSTMTNQTKSLASRVTPGESKRDDFKIESDKVALLIIDVQENLNLAKRADQLPMQNIQVLLDTTRKTRSILQNNGQKGSEVVFTYLESLTENSRDVSLDYKLSGYLAKLPSPSEPAKFVENISPDKGHDILIPKTSCSVFNSTNIDYVLRNLGIEQLVLCGQLTNECVESTARDAADLGYFVTVAEDACLAMSADSHQKGLFGMKGFARIIATSQVVQEFNVSSPKQTNVDEATVDEVTDSSKETTSKSGLVPYQPSNMEQGAVKALLTALRYSKVRHVRFGFVDIDNVIRCKAIPLHRLNPSNLNSLVNMATIVSAGLPSYGDLMIEGSGITAAGNLTLHPDLSSLRILPYAQSSAMIMCYQYAKQNLSTFCTRALLHQVIQTAEAKGLQFCVGAELEFCLYKQDGVEPVDLSLFAHTKTLNEQESFICELEDMLTLQGIEMELIHAESAGGQCELVLKYQDDVLALADSVIMAKETITACARKHAMKAIFLPKTSAMQAGNGLHLHFSFYDKTSGTGSKHNAFPDYSQKESISSKGKSFMEGILKHLPSLLSFTLPTQNSFRRVGVGCWTGHSASWAIEDKEQPLRVCLDNDGIATNVEYKLHDATANLYLSLATMILSGLDGISKNLTLRDEISYPLDANDELLPSSLNESLSNLEKDDFFLNNVGKELITAYIAIKRSELEFFNDKSIDDELEFAYHRS